MIERTGNRSSETGTESEIAIEKAELFRALTTEQWHASVLAS
jgi:hypothetical protein